MSIVKIESHATTFIRDKVVVYILLVNVFYLSVQHEYNVFDSRVEDVCTLMKIKTPVNYYNSEIILIIL